MWYAVLALVSFLAGIGLGCLLAGDRRDRRAHLDEDALSRRAEELMRQWHDGQCARCADADIERAEERRDAE